MSRNNSSSSTGGDSSRGKLDYREFNPLLGPEYYKAENLEKFIMTAGAEEFDRFKDALARERKRLMDEFVRASGLDPHQYDNVNISTLSGQALSDYQAWKARISALHRDIARTGEYRKALQALRYNTVTRLHREGKIRSLDEVSQTEAANVGLAKEVTKADVINKVREMGREGFIEWLQDQVPEGFRANALEEAARQLQVRGFSNIPEKGPAKKVRLYNLIMQQTGGNVRGSIRSESTVQGQAAQTPQNLNLIQELQRRGIQNVGQLTAMTSNDLRELAKQFNVPATGKKINVINSIAAAAAMGVIRDEQSIIADIDELIRLAATDPATARERGRALNPDELTNVNLQKMRQLATALRLSREYPRQGRGGAPSRELIIQTLTGQRTAKSLSREAKQEITTNPTACMQADLQTVQRIAQELRIPITGLTQAQICDRIYASHLAHVSELFLRRGEDLRRIAALPADRQNAEVRRMANLIRLTGVQNLDDLLRQWLTAHYRARAINLFPARQQDVLNFIETGNLPQNPDAVRDLAVVFSDIHRGMYNMSDEERRAALSGLYTQFIQRLRQGGQNAVGAFLANLGRYGFGTFQEGSPVREFQGAANGAQQSANARVNGAQQPANARQGTNGAQQQSANARVNGAQQPANGGQAAYNPRLATSNGRGPTPLTHPNISTMSSISTGNGVQNAHRNMTTDFNVMTSNYDDLRGFATKVASRGPNLGGEGQGDTNAGGLTSRGDYVNPNVEDYTGGQEAAFAPNAVGEGTRPGAYSINNGSRSDILPPANGRNLNALSNGSPAANGGNGFPSEFDL